MVPKGDIKQRPTEVEATPSQPPDALTEVQSPIVAACEPVLPDVVSPAPDEVPVEDVDDFEPAVAVLSGCWHCHDGSGAQEPSTCSRH